MYLSSFVSLKCLTVGGKQIRLPSSDSVQCSPGTNDGDNALSGVPPVLHFLLGCSPLSLCR